MPFLMIRNDITKVNADAIVNPANEELLEGSGTSRAIYLAAGERELEEACRKIGHCDLGTTVATPAFGLNAKYIFHTVGPVWRGGLHREAKKLYRVYWGAMELAADYQLESIAFPVLSSGSYRYPKDKALKIAMNAITDFLVEHDLLVYLVLYDRQALTVSKRLSASVKEYIDDHYVEEKNEDFRGGNGYPMASRRAPETSRLSRPYVAREAKERSVYLPDGLSSPELFREGAPDVIQEKMAPMFPQAAKRSLEELIAHTDETFSQMLLRLIDERGLKDSYVYKKANVDRRHFSKIRNDVDYAPNKKTVLAFAIALELSLDETKDLLMRAGFAFSCCSKFDVIICYFIENRQYDIFKINEMLFVYGQPILGE